MTSSLPPLLATGLLLFFSSAVDAQSFPITPDPARVDPHGDLLPPGVVARLGTVRFRQVGRITDVLFTPDGKRIVTGSSDGTVHVWDAVTGQELRRFAGQGGEVTALALTPDGKRLAACMEFAVCAWELDTGKLLSRWERAEVEAGQVHFAPDNRTLAVLWRQDQSVRLWDAVAGKEVGVVTSDPNAAGGRRETISAVQFSPDGAWLAHARYDSTYRVWSRRTGTGLNPPKPKQQPQQVVRLWDVKAGKERGELGGFVHNVMDLAFSPDGKLLALASERESSTEVSLSLWDVATRQVVRTFGKHRGLTRIAFSPDGKLLASASDREGISLWDVTTGKMVRQLGQKLEPLPPLAFSPDGKLLACGTGRGLVTQGSGIGWPAGNVLGRWEVDSGRQVRAVGEHQDWVMSLAVSPDGKRLASAGCDGTIWLWDVPGHKAVRSLKAHREEVWFTAFSGDGKLVVSAGEDETIRVWDTATGRELRRLPGPVYWGCAVALSPVGDRLVANHRQGHLRFWNVMTGKGAAPTHAIVRDDWIFALAFSADGKLLASGGCDKPLRLWDAWTGKELRNFDKDIGETYAVAFSPDGKLLASGGYDQQVRVWETHTGKLLGRLEGHMGKIYCVTFSPDGRTLASAGQDGAVRLWEVATGRPRGTLMAYRGPLTSVVFLPDGRTLAAAGVDTTVLLWDLAAAALARPRTK